VIDPDRFASHLRSLPGVREQAALAALTAAWKLLRR
jgi:hypothetical protein